MKIEQIRLGKNGRWETSDAGRLGDKAQLVLVFGGTEILKNNQYLEQIIQYYPKALIAGCSTAGEIFDTQVSDDSLVATAVEFHSTPVEAACVKITKLENSFDAGRELARMLPKPGLSHVFIISDGLKINGSDLVGGLSQELPEGVTITGGLSGDGSRFAETLVIWQGMPQRDTVVALGFYGDRIRVGYGSLGGWDPFGPERLITRSQANVLFELEGKSALELYKQYLGEHAKGLPATGLLFPLSIRNSERDSAVVRTILGVNEQEQSMTFAGDVPEGTYARFMKANFDRLIDGAVGAAKTSVSLFRSLSPSLAVLISCVGRKMVLGQRVEEEVEGVREVIGKQPFITGFYSYGEISPFAPGAKCELHNQTMTVTLFAEE